jgi:Cysteine dioxygenase type I
VRAIDDALGLTGADLDEDELVELVTRLAATPALWRPLVRHDAAERHCASLHADAHVGIWVISWLPGHDTGLHDHAGSHGAVAVVDGAVVEERPDWVGQGRSLCFGPRGTFAFDDVDVHRVRCVGEAPAVTIHAYSPPLREMGVYRQGADGSVTRSALRWDRVLAA